MHKYVLVNIAFGLNFGCEHGARWMDHYRGWLSRDTTICYRYLHKDTHSFKLQTIVTNTRNQETSKSEVLHLPHRRIKSGKPPTEI